jgi:signal transduction histidine kinase
MRLVEFIRSHHEAILQDWETFARTLQPASEGMSVKELRDHADQILTAIEHDMESSQNVSEAVTKSRGGKEEGPLGALGQVHAGLRIESGFTLNQVVAEFRALRASVLRRWNATSYDPAGVLRFNETIDEALAQSVQQFTKKTDQYRDQIIGIVSHDLRNPLGAIVIGAAVLKKLEGLDAKSLKTLSRIESSAKRMDRIVGDLLDLTRTRFGTKIPIVRSPEDMDPICQMVIAELQGKYPEAIIEYTSSGDLRGEWDKDRVAQVLSNILGNALQHGESDKPIGVTAKNDGDDTVLIVHNEGSYIPTNAIEAIFEPMFRHQKDPKKLSTGLGLGLYIARELVTSHGGKIDGVSDDSGTTFTVRLPRKAP